MDRKETIDGTERDDIALGIDHDVMTRTLRNQPKCGDRERHADPAQPCCRYGEHQKRERADEKCA